MGTRDKNQISDDGWIRLKLMQMPQDNKMSQDGVVLNPALIPSLEHDDILQIKPIGSTETVCVQYKKNVTQDIRPKDRSIMVCSRIFQNRKDKFPQRGDVQVRKVDKETVKICDFF